jgi:O-antigen/teichoic acid export membrane protein
VQLFKNIKLLSKSVAKFATGEAVVRLSTLALYAFTTRRFGVAVFGIVALAQAVSTYVTLCADQGYKLIGARLVAQYPRLSPYLIRAIVPRRAAFAALATLGGCLYAAWGPLPSASRPVVAAFALAVIPASLALDWILWGTGSYIALSGWKALVSVISSGLAIGGMLLTSHPLWSISIANIVAAIAGSASLWFFVSATSEKNHLEQDVAQFQKVRSELRTSKVVALGTANLLNLVFTNSDMLLLAALTNTTEIGKYGAATRLLFVVFSAYYLLLNTLYPTIAKIEDIRLLKRYLLPGLGVLLVVGVLFAVILGHFSRQALTLIYGPNMHADYLLQILVWAFPFELGVSLISTILASQGYEAIMLRCLFVASALNVTLNLIFIPRFQAVAAAWSTVASYAILWICYLVCVVALKPRNTVQPAIVKA